MPGWIMPLASKSEVEEELADTYNRLDQLANQRHTVDETRRVAAVLRATKWRLRLERQLAAMKAEQ